MDVTAIIVCTITQLVALVIACGGWHVSLKKTREENKTSMDKHFAENYQKLRNEFESLKDDVSGVNATVQQQIAIQTIKIETLSERVNKHNNVIERTYALETQTGRMEQAIDDIKAHLDYVKGAWE